MEQPNSWKTHIFTKPDHVQSVRDAFKNTDITIFKDGEGYLGGAIGSTSFIKLFMESKIKSWVNDIKTLSNVAKSQPHVAYAAYTHDLWNYVLRVIATPATGFGYYLNVLSCPNWSESPCRGSP